MVGRIGNPSYGENHSAGRHSPRSAPKRGGLEGRRSAAQGATLGSALSPPEAPRLCGLKGHRNPAQTSILREAPLAGYAVALESEGQARGTRFHPGLGSVGPSGRGTCRPVSQGFTLGWVPSVLQARGTCRPLSQGFTLGWVPSALQAEAHVARHPRVSPWAGFRSTLPAEAHVVGTDAQSPVARYPRAWSKVVAWRTTKDGWLGPPEHAARGPHAFPPLDKGGVRGGDGAITNHCAAGRLIPST